MATPRRIGKSGAKNRSALLEAAEQLMVEAGYAAVSSRRVAERAGLKPQLLFYYFRSMDDLFLGILHRRAEQGIQYRTGLLDSGRPLHSLWALGTDRRHMRLIMEFISLSHHRPAIRAEVARYAEQLRSLQTQRIEAFMHINGFDTRRFPPGALAVLMTSLSRVITMEETLNVSGGHAEALELISRELDRFENSENTDESCSAPAVSDDPTA